MIWYHAKRQDMPHRYKGERGKKMELGINTDFANEPWELEEIKNKLREIAEAGFTHIH